jgi:TrmH family RNA methyltransferase
MISSPHNEKLKLVRKLRERRHREREGLFATEGEDLVEAGLAAGAEPRFLLSAAGSGLGGEEVESALLAGVSALGSGTRAIAVWPQAWAGEAKPPCVYLHGVADPGNVGAVVRTAHALVGGTVVLGPDCADPFGPKAVRASMGAIFAVPVARVASVAQLPAPRVALVAGGDEDLRGAGTGTLVVGAEREGLPEEVVAACDETASIPIAGDSLNAAMAATIGLYEWTRVANR